MAGSPVAKIAPYVKKYIVEMIVVAGPLFYWMKTRRDNKTYKHLYSKNDFERRATLDDIKEFLSKEEHKH
jgi:hypothetical protein